MRKAARTSTMIALRARREALSIAREIAYPHVEVPHPQVPIPVEELIPRTPPWYELRPFYSVDDGGPAPWWIWVLMAGCLASVAVAAVLILHSM